MWAASILQRTGAIDVLINNAGRGAYRPFHEVAVSSHDAVIDTNLRGIIHTSYALLPAMLERGRGQLVFVSSVLGELPAPDHAVYGATKAAINAFAESLAHELHGQGIGITVVAPGLVRSEFAATSGTPLARFARVPSKSAAADVLRAMERGQALVVSDWLSAVAIRVRRVTPGLFGWIFRRLFARVRRTPDD
jgi:short-subunit dehydrogenase